MGPAVRAGDSVPKSRRRRFLRRPPAIHPPQDGSAEADDWPWLCAVVRGETPHMQGMPTLGRTGHLCVPLVMYWGQCGLKSPLTAFWLKLSWLGENLLLFFFFFSCFKKLNYPLSDEARISAYNAVCEWIILNEWWIQTLNEQSEATLSLRRDFFFIHSFTKNANLHAVLYMN